MKPPNKIPVIQVEICAFCNLRCEMCYYKDMKRKKGFMSFELFKKVVTDAKEMGIKRMRLFVFGEPLLHPELIPFLRYMHEVGMEADITTNGLAMTKGQMQEFVTNEAVWRVVFSLEGFDKETYESIRVGSNYEKVTTNLKTLAAMAKKRKSHLKVEINTLIMDKTLDKYDDFVEYWESLGIKVISHYVLTQAGTVDDYGVKARSSDKIKKSKVCLAPKTKIVVYWDGKIGYCCSDGEAVTAFADVNKESLKDVWTGSVIDEERRKFFSGQAEFCKNCIAYPFKKDK